MGESDELITLDEYDEDDMNVVVETINDDIVGNDIIKKALDENGFTTPEHYGLRPQSEPICKPPFYAFECRSKLFF